MKKKRWKRILSIVLSVAVLNTTVCSGFVSSAADVPSQTVVEEETPDVEVIQDDQKEPAVDKIEDEKEETSFGDGSTLYQNGAIYIYHEEQLKAIGTGAVVHDGDADAATFGKGLEVTDDAGNAVTYSLNAKYVLANDIPLTSGEIWQLPAGFAGEFVGEDAAKDAPLYDKNTDTIYVYHNYQLVTINSEKADTEPVMSNDMVAAEFGVGKFVYPNGSEDGQSYLTYAKSHHYVLSKNFTEQMPELKAEKAKDDVLWLDGEDAGGRTVPGQVIQKIGDETYILIGNETQLRAIGSGKHVTPRLYIYNPRGVLGGIFGKEPTYTPYYPGDADLGLTTVATETGTTHKEGVWPFEKDVMDEVAQDYYTFYGEKGEVKYELADKDISDSGILDGILDLVGGILGSLLLGKSEVCGVDNTGRPNHKTASIDDIKGFYKDVKYTSDANYIIFRDIDLSSDGAYSDKSDTSWDPLMFSGTMIGAKAENGEQLVSSDGTFAKGRPVISNINIEEKGDGKGNLDVSKESGVGFFGTISSKQDENNLGQSSKPVEVKNIELEKVSVESELSGVKVENLVDGLLGAVSGLLGGILDWVLGILGINLDIEELLTNLLTAKSNDPTIYAVGSFAGRVVGEVNIEDCAVTEISNLTNQNKDIIGGFVGAAEGSTKYGNLGTSLDVVTQTLVELLNIIPGLGLGELIEVLLGKEGLLPVGALDPTGYYNPQFLNCSVSGVSAIGDGTKSYVGGFVGRSVGVRMENCSVGAKEESLLVKGKDYVGGFAGAARNGEIEGTLQLDTIVDGKYDLFSDVQIQSKILNSSVNSKLKVEANQYAGGFAGVLANSYAIDDTLANVEKVKSSKDYAGGFTGLATYGWGATLGKDEGNSSLVGTVGNLLGQITTGEKRAVLLSVTGVMPSVIAGANINGTNFSVESESGSFVGGIAGKGDGIKILKSNAETIKETSSEKVWASDPYNEKMQNRAVTLNGLKTVTAGKDYVGGILGYGLSANGAGVLNQTLGLVAHDKFCIQDTVVTGVAGGYEVIAEGNCAGGAVGQGAGGMIEHTYAGNLSKVSAKNYAGGFIGSATAVGLLDTTDTLDILGLGLIEAKNLLSLAQYLDITVKESYVSDREINESLIQENKSGVGTQLTAENGHKGYEVQVTGKSDGEIAYTAGGFAGDGTGFALENSHAVGVGKITAENQSGYAGGFVGRSSVSGLAELADQENNIAGIVNIDGLLNAVPYLIPEYKDCTVTFVEHLKNEETIEPQVQAEYAGGFTGEMQSGTVDNTSRTDHMAVYGVEKIQGNSYAGGFVGKAFSGAVAATGGLSVLQGNLKVNLSQLLQVAGFYIPVLTNAGVHSAEEGLVVDNKETVSKSRGAGSAGGFIGYGSGVKITGCDVDHLKYTKVETPKDLQAKKATSYFDKDQSKYAVSGTHYAGGYAGFLDIGSAAAVGDQVGILGETIDIAGLVNVLDSVESKIVDSDVIGDIGGYSVLANGQDENGITGHAGGYVGKMAGSSIQQSNAENFAYIIGQESAGGYAGEIVPGDVASIVEKADLLDKVANIRQSLVSVLNTFIPRINDSNTTAIPCGGVVRADAVSDGTILRGCAGGYVGHNNGGQIGGKPADNDGYANANRIRSVYGYEYAGGFTGYLHNADVLNTGSLSILGDLVKIENPLSAIQAVYATETNTCVTGPMRGLSFEDFKKWYDAVGKKGPYGDLEDLANMTEDEYNKVLPRYYYGYEVTAGRDKLGEDAEKRAGIAGGYVGKMVGSKIKNAKALDLRRVEAFRSAGGFAGETGIGALANVGSISLGGLDLTSGLIPAIQTFIPVIKNSYVDGYASGAEIYATGTSNQKNDYVGNAGGYVGYLLGGTITGTKGTKAAIRNLKTVDGTEYAGGFAGLILPGSLLTVDTTSEDGLLDQILKPIIGSPDNLASVLNATLSRVTYSEVSAYGDAGFVVNGAHKKKGVLKTTYDYATAAGGYVGMVQGGIIGDINDSNAGAVVKGVKTVTAGEYAGGFLGLGDVAAVAEVSAGGTNILGDLLGLGALDALDAFRTYVYDSKVIGSKASGLVVNAKEGKLKESQQDQKYKVYSGNAGGFAGSLLNGSIKNSSVEELKYVEAVNYSGGFIGHSGKSGAVDLDKLDILGGLAGNLLGINLGIADVCGSTVNDSTVTGMAGGYTVKSLNGEDEIAGGFIGYGDLARMDRNKAVELKQVVSDQTAAGFIGKTSAAYLIDAGIDSKLLDPVLKLVVELANTLLTLSENTEDGSVIHIEIPGLIKVDAIYNDGVLSVNLLGLVISVELFEQNGESYLKINIGDSSITVKADGKLTKDQIKDVVQVSLIKANRTRVAECEVTGILSGYDVFAAGATNERDGTGNGYAGGFVGLNDEGLFKDNSMYQADTIRGAAEQIGEFSGKSTLDSNYTKLKDIEGDNNHYFVYRLWDEDELNRLYAADGTTEITKDELLKTEKVEIDGRAYYKYPVQHMQYDTYKHKELWKGAYQTTEKEIVRFPVNVYVSDAQANLMLETPTTDNISDPDKSEGDQQDPCSDMATLTIQKIWYDNNNKDGKRPENITVTVTQDGKDYTTETDVEWTNPITMNADMSTTDPNVWTTTVKVPANKDNGDGTYTKYVYDVNEDSLAKLGYITIYGRSEDGYTLYIYNYRTEELAQEDTVVIDYGLSVDIDVLKNDKLKDAGVDQNSTLASVGVRTEHNEYLLGDVTENPASGFAQNVTGKFGTAEAKEGTNIVRYTPNTMQMNSYEKLMYAVKLDESKVKNRQNYVYGELNVIPATEIFYEDNFQKDENGETVTGGINYVNGTAGTAVNPQIESEEETQPHGEWITIDEGTGSEVQDTDRPGSDEIGHAWDDWYGNDTHYEDDLKYSNGTSHVVTVDESYQPKNGGTFPYAEFTFQGTGFDVISVTSGTTGRVYVEIFKPGDGENKEEKVRGYTIDTYYGYIYDSENDTWIVNEKADDSNALYQIPILKVDNLEYGKYHVKVTPEYYASNDHHDTGSYKFYLDAIRIYNPAGDPKNPPQDEDYAVIDGVYNQDGEQQPRFTEIRELLLNAENMSGVPQFGTVFVDGNGNLNSIKDYESFGPKNEVYLDKGQGISFYLWSDYIPDKVQLSAKLAQGNTANLGLATAVKENENPNENDPAQGWKYYKIKEQQIKTAYDLYYDLSEQCIWEEAPKSETGEEPFRKYRTKYPILIVNSETSDSEGEKNTTDGVLSLTNLQWTGVQEEESNEGIDTPEIPESRMISEQPKERELLTTSTRDNVEAAYYFINMKKTHNITVNYVDQAGNTLANSEVITGEEGSTYDVTELAQKAIEGYEIAEVQGQVKGTISSDVQINVVYRQKTYSIRVEYTDVEGQTLADPYVQEKLTYGTPYDVTEQIQKEIEGYEFSQLKGDAAQGVIDEDKIVTVQYKKAEMANPGEDGENGGDGTSSQPGNVDDKNSSDDNKPSDSEGKPSNNEKPLSENGQGKESQKESQAVKTGDVSNMMIPTLEMGVALLAIITMSVKYRKRNKRKNNSLL